MEWIFYGAIIFVALTVFANLLQVVIYPPEKITREQLPKCVQSEIDSLFDSFVPDKVLFTKFHRRYTLQGTINQQPCRIEVDLTASGDIEEIDFKDEDGPNSMRNKTKISVTRVPNRVAERIQTLFDGDSSQATNQRAFSGMIGNENAFEFKFRANDFKYEIEVTESGRLVEFEKERIRGR